MKRWKQILQANAAQKQEEATVLISNKAYFKPKLARRDNDCHFILVERGLHQEDVIIVNMLTSIISEPNFIKETLLDIKAHIYPNTIVGDFNMPLSSINRSYRQKTQENRTVK